MTIINANEQDIKKKDYTNHKLCLLYHYVPTCTCTDFGSLNSIPGESSNPK